MKWLSWSLPIFPTAQFSFSIPPHVTPLLPPSLPFPSRSPHPFNLLLVYLPLHSHFLDVSGRGLSGAVAGLPQERGFLVHKFCQMRPERRQKQEGKVKTCKLEFRMFSDKRSETAPNQHIFVMDGVDAAGPYPSGDKMLFISMN